MLGDTLAKIRLTEGCIYSFKNLRDNNVFMNWVYLGKILIPGKTSSLVLYQFRSLDHRTDMLCMDLDFLEVVNEKK